ncbi:MAG: Glycogen debranching enzyme [candidate division BRC1 bacterium ADurb.BinA364]|nr:MAG: Glycogen debranching enzyme [candidate division BRC1 bacterium ADurb.BinA364]
MVVPCAIEPGRPLPLGATRVPNGFNLSIFSQHATAVQLLLYDDPAAAEPARSVWLDPETNRSFHFWHAWVPGMKPGAAYAWRVDSPFALAGADAADMGEKCPPLLDPCARGVAAAAAPRVQPSGEPAFDYRAVAIDTAGYDWEGVEAPRIAMRDLLLYETHVRGFTRHASSGVRAPGTFAGAVEKLPYIKSLGVNAVAFLPIFAFDDRTPRGRNPLTGETLRDYWGFSTIGYFAPHGGYCATRSPERVFDEFRDMVKAFHAEGIEIFLHINFGDAAARRPCASANHFRGLDPVAYCRTGQDGRERLNLRHPIVRKFVLDCLEYWAGEARVDGFLIDEPSLSARDSSGESILQWLIECSETLRHAKIVAVAGEAPSSLAPIAGRSSRCAILNAAFRDDARRFVKGDGGMLATAAARLAGSADQFEPFANSPLAGVNCVASHAGFTLHDLVTYSTKRNEANGEENRDGPDDNLSWNGGAEGEAEDFRILEIRTRQIKNFAAMLFLSQGAPLMLGGDEFRRTQRGNNNAWLQDNEISWIDWRLAQKNEEIVRFFREMIVLRKSHSALRRDRFFTGVRNERGLPDVQWHGCLPGQPGWHDPHGRALAFTLAGFGGEPDLHIIFNMHYEPARFTLPIVEDRQWLRKLDTACRPPHDIVAAGQERPHIGDHYHAKARSVVALIGK